MLKGRGNFQPFAAVVPYKIFRGVEFHEVGLCPTVKDFEDCKDVCSFYYHPNKGK